MCVRGLEGFDAQIRATASHLPPPISNLQGVPNNYETDLIFPIVQRAASLAGVDYHNADNTIKTALKVGEGGRNTKRSVGKARQQEEVTVSRTASVLHPFLPIELPIT